MVAVGVGRDLPGADWLVADTRTITVDALDALFRRPGRCALRARRDRTGRGVDAGRVAVTRGRSALLVADVAVRRGRPPR